MRNVFRVFLRDLKRIAKAPASWSVVLFLLVLPSLYTWFNVLGFWDPYTNTGALPVCVVNEDTGTDDATLGELDLGKQIVEQLEENDQLDWQFMDRESAMQLLNEGKVYAVFVVPENFSTDLATIITDDFHQPQLEYYVNEKTGPVSPKITDIGSSTLDTTINDTFVSTVSSTIAQALNSAVSDSETKFDESKSKVVEQLNEVEQNLGDAGTAVSDLSATAGAAITKTEEAQASLDTAKAEIADMSLALTQLSSLTGTVNSSMLTSTSKLGTALDKGSVSVTGASAKANTAVSESANVIVQSQASVKEAATQAKSLTKTNEAYIDQLETLVDDLEKQLQSQSTSISDLQAEIDALTKKQADQEAIEQAVKDAIKADGASGSGSGSSSSSGSSSGSSSSGSSSSSSGSSSSSSDDSSSGGSSAGSDSGSSFAGRIDTSGIGALSDSTQQKIDELKKQLEEQKSDAEQQQAAKEQAIKMLREVISSLRTANSNVATQAGALASFSDSVSTSAKQVADTTDTITQAVNQTISAADDYRSVLSSDTIPQVSKALSSIGGTAASLGQIVGQQTALVDETGNVLDQLKTTLQTASGALDSTNGLITDAESQIANVRTDIIALSTSNKLSELFGEDGSIDVDKVADFMKSPTEVVTEQLYPLNAYGSAMAPLFINLTLWIGVFMLMVIMHVEVDDEGIKKLKISERFLGRGLLFAIMVSLQAVICVAGCLYLGVQTVDAPRFFLTAICCSLTYLAIQYTLSATLQHVGKGLCVILVFVQIPAATGLYPVELTTGFFRAVYPLFPFTYGINAMRETICGFYGDAWIQLLGVLGVYFIVFLLIGVFIRPLFTNTNRMFARQLTETDIINHEAVQLPERRYRVEQIVRAMSDHDEFRSSLVQHSVRFFKLYPKLKRGALVFGAAVPVLFTLGIAVLSPGKKVIILTAWLIWLVLIIGFLLIIEHIRDSLNRQAALDKMSDAELRELFSERNNVKGHRAADAASDADFAGAADDVDGRATDAADAVADVIVEGPVSDKEAEVLSAVSAFEPNVIHAINVDSVELYCTKPVEVHCAFAKPVVPSVDDSDSQQGRNGDSGKVREDSPDNQPADHSDLAQTTDSEGGDAR